MPELPPDSDEWEVAKALDDADEKFHWQDPDRGPQRDPEPVTDGLSWSNATVRMVAIWGLVAIGVVGAVFIWLTTR